MLCLIGVCLVGEILCFIFVKEKPEIVVTSKRPSRQDLHQGLKALFHMPYFYIAIAMFTLNYYNSLSVVGIGKYYARYVLGNENIFSLFGTIPMITMAIGLLLTPLFSKIWSKRVVLVLAVSFVCLGHIAGSCFPFSFWVGFVGVMIKGFGSAVFMSQLFTLAPEVVTYIELKIGIRVEGLAASANSFGQKIGSGLGTAVVFWALSICGYVAKAKTQSTGVIYTFITLYWWVPTAATLILLVLACFWNIETKIKALQTAKALPATSSDNATKEA